MKIILTEEQRTRVENRIKLWRVRTARERSNELKRYKERTEVMIALTAMEPVITAKFESKIRMSLYITSGVIDAYKGTEMLSQETYNRAWEIASFLQDRFELEDGAITKVFSSYYDEPRWYWKVDFGEYYINIYWAEPDVDCIPQREVSTNKYWTCRK